VSPVTGYAWACHRCGETAGSIALVEHGAVHRERFTGTLTLELGDAAIGQLRVALAAGDAAAVYLVDADFAPWWCPACRKSYRAQHWPRWDVFEGEEPSSTTASAADARRPRTDARGLMRPDCGVTRSGVRNSD
jgi:hypothetical protein